MTSKINLATCSLYFT